MNSVTKELLDSLTSNCKELEQQLIEWRHIIHMNPETAFEEKQTSEFVASVLETAGLDVQRGIGGTGVVASLKCGTSNRSIGLRADMDALNMIEVEGSDHRSKIPGKMHGCGHDGHTVMLLGAALILAHERNFDGTVRFIFQPAEEPGRGAKAMLKDGLLERFPIDEIFGIHNRPVKPFGTIHTAVGGVQGSEDDFEIIIKGKGGHASAPQNTVDPLVIAAQIIMGLQTVVSRNANPQSCAVVSCTEIITDGSHNAIPSTVRILGDARSYLPSIQSLIERRMRMVCEKTCEANDAVCEFTYSHEFAPTINWKQSVEKVIKAAQNVVGADNTFDNFEPSMGSEDFGEYLQKIPGCQAFLGTGENENMADNIPLHNSKFDFNDKIIMTGVKYWVALVHVCLPES